MEECYRSSVCMNTLSVLTVPGFIISNAVTRKTSQIQNQSNDAVMNKVNLSLGSRSLSIYNIFPSVNPFAGSTLKAVIILSRARLDSWMSAVLQNLTTKNIRGGSRKMQYCAVFGKFLQMATNHIIGTLRRFDSYWEPQELYIPNIEPPFEQ